MAAAADILVSGGVYYKDAVDHRGPLTPYVYAVVFFIAGRYNMLALRILLLLVVVGSTLLVWMVARKTAGQIAGSCAAFLFAIQASAAFPASDLFAFNVEWLLAFFVLLGSLFVISMGRNVWMAFGAGIFFGLAFLSKQTAAFECIGVATFAALLAIHQVSSGNREGFRKLVPPYLMVGAGFSITVASVVLFFRWTGAWRDFLFGFWSYNTSYYVGKISILDRIGVLVDIVRLAAGAAGLGVFAIIGGFVVIVQMRRRIRSGESIVSSRIFCLIWAVAAVAGMTLSGRIFGHYFIQVLAPFCILTGIAYAALDSAIRQHHEGWRNQILLGVRRAAVLVVLIGLVIRLASLLPERLEQQERWVVDAPTVALCHLIGEYSAPEDRIFVWGFYPHPYVLARRSPASRYTFCTFITGSNVGKEVLARPVPGAMDHLVSDLQRSRPRFIIDTSPWGYFGWRSYPIENFPKLKHIVDTGYIRWGQIGDADGDVHFSVFIRRSEP